MLHIVEINDGGIKVSKSVMRVYKKYHHLEEKYVHCEHGKDDEKERAYPMFVVYDDKDKTTERITAEYLVYCCCKLGIQINGVKINPDGCRDILGRFRTDTYFYEVEVTCIK